MRRSAIRGCHAGSVEAAAGRIGGNGLEEASAADSTSRWTDSATGFGAGVFLGRPRRRLGATSSTGGANRDEIGGRGAGCKTVAGSRGRPRRRATGDKDDGRVGAQSTTRSILTVGTSSVIVGAWAGSRGGVSGPTGGSAVTGTGTTCGLATTGASLEAPGSGLPENTSSACKGKIAIGLIWARVR